MSLFNEVPFVGQCVIAVIAALFVLSVFVLFGVCIRFKSIARQINGGLHQENRFLRYLVNQYEGAYELCGKGVDTVAVVEDVIRSKLGGALLFERFLNNAVSLFVTLGLFGTFLGLSMSVSSLTSLIANSNADEWMSILNSVGDGLLSTLSGMGVAFYTSLFGVGCAIVFTIMKSIWSTTAAREFLVSKAEIWLDQVVSKSLPESPVDAKAEIAAQNIIADMRSAVDAMRASMGEATELMRESLSEANEGFETAATNACSGITEATTGLKKTVSSFNNSVHGFNDFDHALRGTVERLDLAVRDFGEAVNKASGAAKQVSGK